MKGERAFAKKTHRLPFLVRKIIKPLRSEWLTLIRDALLIWDFVTFSVSGWLCALLHTAIVGHADTSGFARNSSQIILLGGLMAAVILWSRQPRAKFGTLQLELAQSLRHVLRSVAIFVFLLLAVGFITRVLSSVSRLWLAGWMLSAVAAALGGRMLAALLLRMAVARGLIADQVAIIGWGPAAQRLIQHMGGSAARSGIRIVGTFGQGGKPWSSQEAIAPLLRLAHEGRLDRVILALPADQHAEGMAIAERLKMLDVETLMFPDMHLEPGLGLSIFDLGGAPLMVVSPRPIPSWGLLAKLTLDRTLSALALIILAPLLALIAVAIRLDSPGPIIFRQPRYGRNNVAFDVLKFRSMRELAVQNGSLVQTSRDDPRITPVGRFLRKTSLDELPQLFNVLGGSMSLVGPRPHAVIMRTEEMLGEEIIAAYPQRHRVRPGVTGWAQVSGHRGATHTAQQIRQRVEHDIYYIENWSLLLDLKILLMTPFSVLFRRDNAF